MTRKALKAEGDAHLDIKVVARHGELSRDLRAYAREKMAKLERYFEGVHWVTVTLDDQPELKKAEVVMGAVRGTTLVAEAEDHDLHAAIDRVVDKAEHQLTKFKEKLKGRRSQ